MKFLIGIALLITSMTSLAHYHNQPPHRHPHGSSNPVNTSPIKPHTHEVENTRGISSISNKTISDYKLLETQQPFLRLYDKL